MQQYEAVRDQIDRITDQLEQHKTALLIDIGSLYRLYVANLEYFRVLEQYIATGEAKLREIDADVIPAVERDTGADTLAAQRLRDLRARRDDLERRVHDLRLTRQVTLQSLPSIRLVQENDKALVGKINSTLVNTVPLWRQQLAQALTIHRSREAAQTVAAATDLTNDLLRAIAENLRQANVIARTEMERGVFDIAAVAEANRSLISAIEDSLRIADEGGFPPSLRQLPACHRGIYRADRSALCTVDNRGSDRWQLHPPESLLHRCQTVEKAPRPDGKRGKTGREE